jgi:hypothetical protein
LALGKTIAQVRAMPYDEFESWKTFYLIEPWGWHDREYRIASLLSMIVNVNVKKENQVGIKDFYRDMFDVLQKIVIGYDEEQRLKDSFKNASKAERARMIAASFGGTQVKEK